jgi:hypothetical protein
MTPIVVAVAALSAAAARPLPAVNHRADKRTAERGGEFERESAFGRPRKLTAEQTKLVRRLIDEGRAVPRGRRDLQCPRGDDLRSINTLGC